MISSPLTASRTAFSTGTAAGTLSPVFSSFSTQRKGYAKWGRNGTP
ncbi:hypothetical protein AAGR22_00565 [Erwinia sp. HDF1-3R]